MFDCEFTHLGKRYETDCDTYRIIFEVLGTEQERLIMAEGIKKGKIKEVIRDE